MQNIESIHCIVYLKRILFVTFKITTKAVKQPCFGLLGEESFLENIIQDENWLFKIS